MADMESPNPTKIFDELQADIRKCRAEEKAGIESGAQAINIGIVREIFGGVDFGRTVEKFRHAALGVSREVCEEVAQQRARGKFDVKTEKAPSDKE